MSKYDSIETAKNLIREVISNGLITDQEDINRAADIFGNTSIEELAKLANSDATISGKRVGDTFYFIAFRIWNWQDATRFYNEHTLAVGAQLRELREAHKATKEENEKLNGIIEVKRGEIEELRKLFYDMSGDKAELENALQNAQCEVVLLKARLYDMMTAGA